MKVRLLRSTWNFGCSVANYDVRPTHVDHGVLGAIAVDSDSSLKIAKNLE